MEIHINQVVSVVGSVDGDLLLSEGALKRIVEGVLNGLAEEERNRKRAAAGRSVRGGRGEHAERTAPEEARPGGRVTSVSITIYPDSDDTGIGAPAPGDDPQSSRPDAKRDRSKKKR
jgi:hypothetical protein